MNMKRIISLGVMVCFLAASLIAVPAPRVASGRADEERSVDVGKTSDNSMGNVEVETRRPMQVQKKKFPIIIVAAGVVVVGVALYFLVLRKPTYKLTVQMDPGVTGNPLAGVHEFKKGDVVNYTYTADSGYKNLTVTLDGQSMPTSGSFKMSGNHTLKVSAGKIGQYTGITLQIKVLFAGSNYACRQKAFVNSDVLLNEVFTFPAITDKYDSATKIERTLSFVMNGLGSFKIRQEDIRNSFRFLDVSSSAWVWGTEYTISVIDHAWIDGVDPGVPEISEATFYLKVSPWAGDWAAFEEKVINITLPSTSSPQHKSTLRKNSFTTVPSVRIKQ